MRIIYTVALATLAATASAQYVVAPNAYAATAGNAGLNTFIRDVNAPRSGQLMIAASQLGTINAGDQITGISFRLWTGATIAYPGATYAQYDVFVGKSVDLAARSTTYAANVDGALTQVRSGPLTFNPNAFTVGGTPNAWGQEITFSTPYVYGGGPLLIEIRHGGSNITNPTNTFLDALTTATVGYGIDFASITAADTNATVGAAASFTITRLSVAPVPEPASMAALGLGLAAFARRRRARK
jgi:hypothetical protein